MIQFWLIVYYEFLFLTASCQIWKNWVREDSIYTSMHALFLISLNYFFLNFHEM